MSWATPYITKLQAGETVQFRPRGSSMMPKIKSGQLCTVAPLDENVPLAEGDIVLCKVNGKQYLHLIKAVQHGGSTKSATTVGTSTGGSTSRASTASS